ncbi:hypothetical protein M422DRAFT_159164 [Sphaerobolus stellatus SS14]|nr:hypothetical protein M422DRAFT_159164 [Sphaerobolus stellatus SS14]
MLSLSDSYPFLDLLFISAVFISILVHAKGKQLRLPPGPKPLPIVGNWFELPGEKQWETYNLWAKEYGDIVHVKDFGKDIIILNSFKAASDLLEKKSNLYSSRPQLIMFHEMMDFGGTTSFQPYGNTWRKHRTLYNRQLHKGAMGQFEALQYSAVKRLLPSLVDSPEKLRKHVRHMAAAIVLDFAYGYDLQGENDPLLSILQGNIRMFVKAIKPGAFLVDNFPILKFLPDWFPGAGFKKIAAEARVGVYLSRDIPFKAVKEALKAGIAKPSFVGNSLLQLGLDDESNEDIDAVKRVAAGILGAGTDTTASTLMVFILAMATHPQYMRKAQEELSKVVGQSRLPEFDDRPALPYIEAILKEVLRWFPVVPTGLPHATTMEDVYEGYRIPSGSIVIPNTWKMLHDPETYPDPYVFRPERFIPDTTGRTPERDPSITGSFGFGRRICAGRNLAEATLWLTIATLLTVFDFANAVDEHGTKLDPKRAIQPAGGGLW